ARRHPVVTVRPRRSRHAAPHLARGRPCRRGRVRPRCSRAAPRALARCHPRAANRGARPRDGGGTDRRRRRRRGPPPGALPPRDRDEDCRRRGGRRRRNRKGRRHARQPRRAARRRRASARPRTRSGRIRGCRHALVDRAARSQHRERGAARRTSRRWACDRAEDHRLPPGARALPERRRARGRPRHRPLEAGAAEGARDSLIRPTAHAAALCLGLAAANVARFSPVPAVAALACARAPCAIAVAGWWWGSRRLHALDRSVLLARVGTAERALVETEEPLRIGRFGVRVRALVLRWGATRPREPVLLELPSGRAPPQGSRLSLVGVLKLPRGQSHGFDEATWLRRQGIHVVLRVKEWCIVGRRAGVGGIGDRLQRWLAGDSAFRLRGARRAVVEAVVLGHAQGLDDTLLARFRASGLYHCLAVDGLKVGTVAAGALALMRLLGLGRIAAEVAALAAVGAYTLAVGFHPSVVRAAVAAAL